jgi:predicted Zn-dependent protease
MERLHERDLNTSRRREVEERADQIEHSQRQERQFEDLASDRIRSAEEAMEARYASRMETLARGEKVRERRATRYCTLYIIFSVPPKKYEVSNLCTLRNNVKKNATTRSCDLTHLSTPELSTH